VRQARAEGLRSRAAYKLLEIDARDRLFAPGALVVDLGAAPGGWSQVAVRRVGPRGRVIALDLLEMTGMAGVTFIQGDFREESVLNQILERLGGDKADLVLSDMAPNISGVDSADQAASIYLLELALDLVRRVLKPGAGALLHLARWNPDAIDVWRTKHTRHHHGGQSLIHYNHPDWLAESARANGLRFEQVGDAFGWNYLAWFSRAR